MNRKISAKKRDKDRGDHRQHLHHIVGAVADAGEIEVEQAGQGLAVVFDAVHHLDRVIVVASNAGAQGEEQRLKPQADLAAERSADTASQLRVLRSA